jgi:hypothetical protein
MLILATAVTTRFLTPSAIRKGLGDTEAKKTRFDLHWLAFAATRCMRYSTASCALLAAVKIALVSRSRISSQDAT